MATGPVARFCLRLALCLTMALGYLPGAFAFEEPLRVGSKRFTESYVLGELLTQTASPHGPAEHRQGLGNTAIVLAALQAGSIDVYPEYLGTIDLEILKHKGQTSLEQMRRELAALGLGIGVPLGFNNTYALAVRGDAAAIKAAAGIKTAPGIETAAGIKTLSELARQPALRFGLSHEFIGRADGWPGLAQRYRLTQQPRGLDHGIAYEALQQGQVDVIDIYSTDAKIAQYGLKVLQDDLGYFPRYDAVLLYRLDLPARHPKAWQAIGKLEGRISASEMIAMNADVEIKGQPFAAVARAWLAAKAAPLETPGKDASTAPPAAAAKNGAAAQLAPAPIDVAAAPAGAIPANGLWDKIFDRDMLRLTGEHLMLVLLSVALACVVGLPLGVLAAFVPRLRQTVLALAGVLQTVPSLALLAILIPLLGTIGTLPALVALFVYALLPIVRNTCTGILQVPAGLRLAALALGLSKRQRLLHIDFPLSLPVILAGIKTAAVMSVGTATIAAFIGAGGYGERITIGLALNDNSMLLAGAIPAAVLALLMQALFELGERLLLRRASS